MNVIDKIDIPAIDLENQKITDFTELSLEIRDNSVVYTARFYADEPKDENDKELGWHNVFNCFKLVASRENIAGIEINWLAHAKKWSVLILVNGFQNDIKMYFKREGEAQNVFDKLHKWLYE
jgi:hypothetical protein